MNTNSHKSQHFVPQCYLKPWCDPDCPPEYEPYVWLFERDGTKPRKKAPSNIFKETDFYTVEKADGTRDLSFEHGLSGLESKFASIRESKLSKQLPMTEEEHAYLGIFVAATQFRTRSSREHHANQWQHALDLMDDLADAMSNATHEQKRAAARISSSPSEGKAISHEQVRRLAEYPLQTMMTGILQAVTPVLTKMNMLILNTDDPVGFITSDRPVTWFDPEAYKLPPLYRAPALASPTIEVTMPLSPKQCLIFAWQCPTGYVDAPAIALNELNRRHRALSGQHIVVQRQSTAPYWFEDFDLPDDAWENTQNQSDG